MRYDQLVQLYFERSNALQWYWTLYVVVIGGLLAFSTLRTYRDFISTVLLTVLFVCFAFKNLDAIHDTTLQRFAALDAIHHYEPGPGEGDAVANLRPKIEPTLLPPAYDGVRRFHVFSDLLTVITLWAIERRRLKKA